MGFDLRRKFVIGVSSRALFDLAKENLIYETKGLQAYRSYQLAHRDQILQPGPAFKLISKMCGLNQHLPQERQVEVLILSRNSPDLSPRISKSIEYYSLPITRSVFSGGASVSGYAVTLPVHLFLSASPEDVAAASKAGVPAALVYGVPKVPRPGYGDTIRVAFDGDAVLFDESSERIYQDDGLVAFHEHERSRRSELLRAGPFAKVLASLAYIQRRLPKNPPLIRTLLITARNSPAHERVLTTLNAWRIQVDEIMFLGGIDKARLLREFGADMFFDDQASHCGPASAFVPTAQVPSNLFPLMGPAAPNCPVCGGKMVLRTARRGSRAGAQFYGCSTYPQCDGLVSVA